MWILLLNDMRMPHVETLVPVAKAETKEVLEAYLAREKVEPYQDGQWGKTYRQGGPLEWYNPPSDIDRAIVDVRDKEAHMKRAAERAGIWWDRDIEPIPKV
jgi:hypothetical protein